MKVKELKKIIELPKDTYTIKTYHRVYQYSKGDT